MTASEPEAAPVVGTLSDQEIAELGRSGALITEGLERDNIQQACYELRAGRAFYEPDKGNRRQTVAAIALGVVANAVTSILTIAATSLRRRRRARDPA